MQWSAGQTNIKAFHFCDSLKPKAGDYRKLGITVNHGFPLAIQFAKKKYVTHSMYSYLILSIRESEFPFFMQAAAQLTNM